MSVHPDLPRHIFRYDYKLTWTIGNFDFRQKGESTVTSPKFDVKCIDVTTWSFQILISPITKRDSIDFAVRLHYSSSPGACELFITSVNFAIYLIDSRGRKDFHTDGSFIPSFSEPISPPIKFIPMEKFQDFSHLQDDSFVVVCKLTTWINHQEYASSVYREQFVSLGNCIFGLFNEPSSTDVIAFSREKRIYHVHLCILHARCPIIFHNSLDIVRSKGRDRHVWYSSISTATLRILLSYLYGKIKIEVPNHLKLELLSVATRYQLQDLVKKLREYPINLVLESQIIVENIKVELPFNDGIWDKKNGEYFYEVRFEPTHKLSVDLLKLSFSSDGVELDVTFSFSMDFVGKEPILLKCFLFFLKKNKMVLVNREEHHIFRDNTPWSVSILDKTDYNNFKPHVLICEVKLSEGSSGDLNSPNQNSRVEPHPCIVINNLFDLSRDLKLVYEKRINCDLKIVINEQVFFGHRWLLKQRSEGFKRDLETLSVMTARKLLFPNDDEILNLNVIMSPRIFQIVLQYIYYGTIDACDDLDDLDTANELLRAAHYFRLPHLEAASMAAKWLEFLPSIELRQGSNPGLETIAHSKLESTLKNKLPSTEPLRGRNDRRAGVVSLIRLKTDF